MSYSAVMTIGTQIDVSAPAKRPRRPLPKVMTLTEAAASRVRAILSNAGSNAGQPVAGVRVGVKNGGCAGMEYTLEYVAEVAPHDEVIEDQGVRVLIDPKAVLFLIGTVMDFRTDKLKSGFVFNNPNQTSACGCGESVAITPQTLADPGAL